MTRDDRETVAQAMLDGERERKGLAIPGGGGYLPLSECDHVERAVLLDMAGDAILSVVPLVEARVRRDITRQIEAMRQEFADTLDGDNWKQTRDTLDEVLALVEQRVEADHAP